MLSLYRQSESLVDRQMHQVEAWQLIARAKSGLREDGRVQSG
jgi:hypothetical protein